MHDQTSQRVLLLSAGIDHSLIQQIPLGIPPLQFAHVVVDTLLQRGTLEDAHHAIESILQATKQYLGYDGRSRCETIIQALQTSSPQE